LEKSEHNTDFHPMVDFIEASPLSPNSTGFNEFSSKITTALVCLPTNRTYIFSKMIFDGLVKNVNNKISKFLMYPRITQSSVLLTVAYKPASLLRDVSQGEACPTDSGFIVDQDRATIDKTSTLPHNSAPWVTSPVADEGSMKQTILKLTALCTSLQTQLSKLTAKFQAQEVEINMLKERVKMLEDRKGVAATRSGDDAPINGEEVIDVPTGSGSIPTASTPAEVLVPTGSEEVPTAGPVFATATVVTPYSRRKGKEVMVESDTSKKQKVQEQIDAQEYHQFSLEIPIERRIELISNLVKYQDNYAKIYKFQSQQRKPWTKKQKRDNYMVVIRSNLGWKKEDFIPIGSKEEAERIKRKDINLDFKVHCNPSANCALVLFSNIKAFWYTTVPLHLNQFFYRSPKAHFSSVFGKFKEKGDEGYFIGYSMSSNAFRVFNKRTRRVEENLHVEFLENKAIKKGSGPNWLFDIDSLTKSINYVLVDAGTISTNLSGTKDAASQEVKKDVSSLRYIALPNWAHDALLEFASSKPQDHYSTEVPEGNTLGVTTSLDESNRVQADISNMETSITASPTPTLRIHKDHPKNQIIGPMDTPIQTRNKSKEMDVKSAFLYGIINEEVYVMQPLGFQDPDFPAKCIKWKKRCMDFIRLLEPGMLCREFKALMHEKFQMSAMGELNFFLGLQVLRKEDGIFISQDKFVRDILKKFRYSDVRDCFEKKLISMDHIHTDENVADLLTKPFDAGRFQYLVWEKLSTVSVFLGFGLTFAGTFKYWGVLRILMISLRLIPLSEHNIDFHPMVDFIEASPLRTVTESSLRRNLKLEDEEGISSLPDTKLFENLTLMGYNISPNQNPNSTGFNEFSSKITTALVCLATNRTYNFLKMIFDGLVKNVNNKISKFLMYPRRTRIAQSSVLLTVVDEPAYPLRDVSQREACHTDSGFIVDQDRATIDKSSTLPHDSAPWVTSPVADEGSMQQTILKLTALCTSLQTQLSELTAKFQAQEVEINMLKERVKMLEDREGVAATRSGDDAPAPINKEEVIDVPTGGRSIPTTSTPAEVSVPTGSEEVPTAGPVFATATVVTLYSRRKGKEVMVESDTPKKQKVQEQIDAQKEDFIPIGSKEEAERIKWKGINLEQESAKNRRHQRRSLRKQSLLKKSLKSGKGNDAAGPHRRKWKLYDTGGVHHVTAKDKEILMLVEKDYPLRKRLALVMISYKLLVENYS
nr:retrotransposon protein, putative, unclassified [Tanacetum cinerariifolium]